MLGQRRRRWANISSALGQRRVLDRLYDRKLDRNKYDTHRQRLTDSTERTQVKQHVPTSSEGGRGT